MRSPGAEGRLAHAAAVDERAVGGVEVDEHGLAAAPAQLGVAPRGARVVERHVAGRAAADDRDRARERRSGGRRRRARRRVGEAGARRLGGADGRVSRDGLGSRLGLAGRLGARGSPGRGGGTGSGGRRDRRRGHAAGTAPAPAAAEPGSPARRLGRRGRLGAAGAAAAPTRLGLGLGRESARSRARRPRPRSATGSSATARSRRARLGVGLEARRDEHVGQRPPAPARARRAPARDRPRRDVDGAGSTRIERRTLLERRLGLGRDAEGAGRELVGGLERHAWTGAHAVALAPHVLGQVGAELDAQRRLVLGEALAILRRQVDRVLRGHERAAAGLDLAVLELLRELARDLDRLHGHANHPADGAVDDVLDAAFDAAEEAHAGCASGTCAAHEAPPRAGTLRPVRIATAATAARLRSAGLGRGRRARRGRRPARRARARTRRPAPRRRPMRQPDQASGQAMRDERPSRSPGPASGAPAPCTSVARDDRRVGGARERRRRRACAAQSAIASGPAAPARKRPGALRSLPAAIR